LVLVVQGQERKTLVRLDDEGRLVGTGKGDGEGKEGVWGRRE
jgi:hypothetical protein